MVVETEVAEEHGAAEEESGRVGLILALDIQTDVSAAGLENGDITAHVAAGNDTGATDKSGGDVGENATVKVRHDHDVELLGPADALHGGVVDNHVVALELGEILGEPVKGATEETVGQLHDVGLVNASNLLAVVGEGEAESKLGDTLRLGAGDDLERLDDARNALVLETGVFTLGVLTDDAEIDVLVAGLETRNVLDQCDRGVDVEFLTHGDVETLVAGAADGSVEDALEAKLIALQGGNGLVELLLGTAGGGGIAETRDLDLLPGDGDVVGLEDGLDALGNLGTDTVTGNEGNGVLAAILGGLEDVGLNGLDGLVLDAGETAGEVKTLGWLGRCPEEALNNKYFLARFILRNLVSTRKSGPKHDAEHCSCWVRGCAGAQLHRKNRQWLVFQGIEGTSCLEDTVHRTWAVLEEFRDSIVNRLEASNRGRGRGGWQRQKWRNRRSWS